jgi:hypothetical protein
MKKTLFCLGLALLSTGAFAQAAFEKAIAPKLEKLAQAKENEEFTALANDFLRIAEKEKTQWLPYYYTALAYLNNGRKQMLAKKTEQLDALSDEADKYIAQADALSPNNSEIYILKKMSAHARMMVNPMIRFASHGKTAEEALKKAKSLDPNNPRAALLDGQDFYYKPSLFGGSKDKAKILFDQADENFKSAKPETSISPNWGKAENDYMLSLYKK